jgi:NADPH:quinone reductase-like Zn-dependent oxidoreductase
MKAFELCGFGLDQLVLTERPKTQPGAGEVLVKLRAVSLNFRDLLVVQGKYNPRMKLPRVPVSDGAGEVVAVGEGVTAWKLGDRVVIPFMPAWSKGPLSATAAASALGGDVDGLLREFAVISADTLLPIPPHLSFEQAATLPCAGVTAWNGLFDSGNLQRGQTVLELTGGRGVDLTLEVGGAGTLSKTCRATAFSGHISLIGVLAGIAGEVQIGHILHKALTVRGIYVGSREMFAAMNALIVQYKLEPIIDRVFNFEESVAAFQHLETGQHFGKIVIRF